MSERAVSDFERLWWFDQSDIRRRAKKSYVYFNKTLSTDV